MRRSCRLAASLGLACLVAGTAGVARAQAPAPVAGTFADEYDEIRAILDYHEKVARLDGRGFGLPRDDFDDVMMLSLRQRRAFRALIPGTPEHGIHQYPHWAFIYMRYLDGQMKGRAVAALSLVPGPWALIVGANVNVTANTQVEGETYLAIDPTDQRYIEGSANSLTVNPQQMYRSSDYGATWIQSNLPVECSVHSDPALAYDSLGRVYTATLDYTCQGKTHINVYQSTDHGATWSAPFTMHKTNGDDKELMAADYLMASPCRDRLYMAWDDGNVEDVASAGSYLGPWTVTTGLDTGSIGTDIATGPAGEVYDVWANYGAQQINMSKSTDCGMTWSAKRTIATTADGYDYGIPADCDRRVLIYPSVDVDRSGGPRNGWVYVAWNDFTATQSAGCVAVSDTNNANVYFSRSSNGGTTWSAPVIVHSNPARTDQFNQWMRVDDADGAIHVAWNDSRNDPGRLKTDIYYTLSTDGGFTFAPEVKVTTEMTDESALGHNPFQYGDYSGLAVRNGVIYPFWTDRRPSSGTDEEVFTARICSAPKVVGATAATDDPCGGIGVAWSAPTVFWGDGGAGSRKYQLFKDGVLALDNIPAASTSMLYTPGDAAAHVYAIKAVNGCGDTALYGSAPAVADLVSDTTPPAPVLDTLTALKSGANESFAWTVSTSPDVAHYDLYGATTLAGPFPTGWTRIATPVPPSATDPLASVYRFYLVTAVDGCGNESAP